MTKDTVKLTHADISFTEHVVMSQISKHSNLRRAKIYQVL